MTKDGGNVHAPVTLTVYTEDTNKEFVEPTMKITEKKKEREDVYVLGIWIFWQAPRLVPGPAPAPIERNAIAHEITHGAIGQQWLYTGNDAGETGLAGADRCGPRTGAVAGNVSTERLPLAEGVL